MSLTPSKVILTVEVSFLISSVLLLYIYICLVLKCGFTNPIKLKKTYKVMYGEKKKNQRKSRTITNEKVGCRRSMSKKKKKP
jgi:hypothetical protein